MMLAELQKELILPEGFVVRPTILDDAQAVADLVNDADEILTGVRTQTVERTMSNWQSPNFDLESSSIVIEAPNGRIAGHVSVWDTEPVPVSVWVFARVHPDFAGMGIGTALRVWGEQRARQAIDKVPDDAKVVMVSAVLDADKKAVALLQSAGMAVDRYWFRMAIDLDKAPAAPVMPDGVVIRPWSDVKDQVPLMQIAQADNEAFRDHWGHVEQPMDELLKHWEHWIKDDNIDPSIWFLALDGAEIAGVSLCAFKAQGQADRIYLDSLAVRRPWRRKGLALALLHHTFATFYEQGYKRVELHVDASSLTGATKLYERAGMYRDTTSVSYKKVLRDGRDLSVQSIEE